jgi:hypothetical protein
MTRRASQCRAKIAALAVPALQKVVVTTSLDQGLDSVTKNGLPIGDGAHERTVSALFDLQSLDGSSRNSVSSTSPVPIPGDFPARVVLMHVSLLPFFAVAYLWFLFLVQKLPCPFSDSLKWDQLNNFLASPTGLPEFFTVTAEKIADSLCVLAVLISERRNSHSHESCDSDRSSHHCASSRMVHRIVPGFSALTRTASQSLHDVAISSSLRQPRAPARSLHRSFLMQNQITGPGMKRG